MDFGCHTVTHGVCMFVQIAHPSSRSALLLLSFDILFPSIVSFFIIFLKNRLTTPSFIDLANKVLIKYEVSVYQVKS